jgi:N-acetylmuramoyl-L-alanine amidase
MKRKIAISAGHSNTPGQDQGAVNKTTTEGIQAVRLRNGIVEALKQRGLIASVDPDNSVTGKTVALFRQYFFVNDICIDIHFNASSNSSATGCEVLVPAKPSVFENAIANKLSNVISGTLGIANRGVKTELDSARRKLVWMSLPGEAILIETCFLSNESDMVRYNANFYVLCNNIAQVIGTYVKL